MPNNRKYRAIISGGGTGGHIFPAVAIANELKSRYADDISILFVGAKGKMEMEKVPKAGYEIIGLKISGLQRKLTFANLLFPVKVLYSIVHSLRILSKFKPDVAIGVGGYASAALLYAAQLKGIPCLIQEQNSFGGLTNKVLSKKAKKICVAYEGMGKFFPSDKIILTGNPVRKDIIDIQDLRTVALEKFGFTGNAPILFIMGGSLGALSINKAIAASLDKLMESGIEIVWQTGKGYFKEAQEVAKNYPNVKVFEFVYEMNLAYAAADVVVSRAGALSISELCIVGKPSILVPFPFAAEDHQTQNALSLVNNHAAILVKDKDVQTTLSDTIIELIKDKNKQAELALNIKKLAKPNATNEIVNEVIKLC